MPRWDNRLRDYVNQELQHLWGMGAEFEAQNPGTAPGLRLSSRSPQDPFVERLLDGFAFLAARVRLRMDDEFPRLTQSLLESVHPNSLSTTPATTIVQFHPSADQGVPAEGYPLDRGTVLRSLRNAGDTPCTFVTSLPVMLWPLRIAGAQYVQTQDLGSLALPELSSVEGVEAAIRITLELTVKELTFDKIVGLDVLTFHLCQMPRTPISLHEQLLAHATNGFARAAGKPAGPAARVSAPKPVGFDPLHALLPTDPRSFQGYRLLAEYFTLPQKFLFLEIRGLKAAAERAASDRLEIIIPLRKEEPSLKAALGANNFALFCTPAINLFEERIRVKLTDRDAEFAIIPQSDPQDFEVYRIDRLVAGARNNNSSQSEQEFYPFYRQRDGGRARRYFTTRRSDNRFERATPALKDRPAFLEENENGSRKSRSRGGAYLGSDVYVTLVDAQEAPFSTALQNFTAFTLCTNRDLSTTITLSESGEDFVVRGGAPVRAISCVGRRITPPYPSYAEGDFTWRLVDHLTGNYFSLATDDPTGNANSLKKLLELYSHDEGNDGDPRIAAIRALEAGPIQGRLPGAGPIAFARGTHLALTIDDRPFEGTGAFLFGAVLEQFFRRYASINSFTTTSLKRGQTVFTWPARSGSRQVL